MCQKALLAASREQSDKNKKKKKEKKRKKKGREKRVNGLLKSALVDAVDTP